MTRPPGSAIGRYQILGFMARGETTIVYEALEPELGRKVALKILPPSAARDTEGSDFFLRLAARLSVLDHTNLLPVIDYGREDGVPFMATPIAEGGSLAAHMEEFSQPKSALTLAASLALAVDYLHRNDVVHGRIGPGHILLDAEGAPLLTGFGRPYAPGDPGPMPAYLAPEPPPSAGQTARSRCRRPGR
jgi:serine/threonine-protein kinase